MEQVGSSVRSGARLPWLNEPKCSAVTPASPRSTRIGLYRNAEGRGLGCPACHQSPRHGYTSQASDNYQAIQLQNKVKASLLRRLPPRLEGRGMEVAEAHGGNRSRPARSATPQLKTNSAQWPHQFQGEPC
jgi:hypothetical protein